MKLVHQRKNENTSMSEEAKLGHKDEAIAIISSGQKIQVKSKGRFCNNLETQQQLHEW